jgi:hypothetical protein
MTSLKQIEANLLNALKRNGPRTELGKQRSRQSPASPDEVYATPADEEKLAA